MRFFVALFVFLIPFSILSFAVGSSNVEPSLLVAGLIAFVSMIQVLGGRIKLESGDTWFWVYLVFLIAVGAYLPFSAYADEAFSKGVVQVAGLLLMMMTALAISRYVARDGISRVLPPLRLALSVIGLIGVWQFVAFNVFNTDLMADFSFMNNVFTSGEIWRRPDMLAGIERINSINTEPAHFAQYLGLGAGLAVLRLGLFGPELRDSLKAVFPAWLAALVVVGFALSVSVVGLLLLGLTVFAIAMLRFRMKFPTVMKLLGSFAMLSAAIVTVAMILPQREDGFVGKLQTIPLILSSITEGVHTLTTVSFSALAIGANANVALANLADNPLLGAGVGAHPISYVQHAPAWTALNPGLYFLNANDAGGLFLRLASETGLVGLTLFIGGWLVVTTRAFTAIRENVHMCELGARAYTPTLGICIGLTASCAALYVTYFVRMGLYYSPSLWFLLACTAAVPSVLRTDVAMDVDDFAAVEDPSEKRSAIAT